MLKVRIIPTLLWKNIGLVKGVSFNSWRRVGTVMPAIKVYNTRDVDELILLDVSATNEGLEPDYNIISELSAECFVPFTVGGGINSIKPIRNLLRAGADKISINTAAYENPELISEAAGRFGSQCIVASVDVRRMKDGTYECFSRCGSHSTGKDPVEWCMELERLGAGEILITSIDLDGTMKGYDVTLIKNITENVSIPVIASGGAGNYQHMLDALAEGQCSAVAAASIFHFTQQTPLEAKQYLLQSGVKVRL